MHTSSGGQISEWTQYRISNHLAVRLDCRLTDFSIQEVDEVEAHFLIAFSNLDLRERALAIGQLTVASFEPYEQPIEVRLIGWQPEHGARHAPIGYQIRIRLRKVPLHLWNGADVHTLVAGFGYPLRIAPFIVNGNFGTLRVLILCGPPTSIPLHLWVKIGVLSKEVDVEIEGWILRTEVSMLQDNKGKISRSQPPQAPQSHPNTHDQSGPSGHDKRTRRLSDPNPRKHRGQDKGKQLGASARNPALETSNKAQHIQYPDATCNMVTSGNKDENPVLREDCKLPETAIAGVKCRGCSETYYVLCNEWNEQVLKGNNPEGLRYCRTCIEGKQKTVSISIQDAPDSGKPKVDGGYSFRSQQTKESKSRLPLGFKGKARLVPQISKKDRRPTHSPKKWDKKSQKRITLEERLSTPYSFRKDQAFEIYRIAVGRYGMRLPLSKRPHE